MLKNKRNSKPKIRWGLKKICLGLLNITLPPRQARSWIEANFHKRECIKFIPSNSTAFDEPLQCCCGQERALHPIVPGTEIGSPNDKWVPNKHTRSHPTDAYGTIEFQGGAHPTKAQYVRLSYDTRPELLVQLFTREWNLELPKLLISVQGGKANFDLQPKLKKVLRKGLLRAAKTTGAWIFTGGTNTGVTKQVGDALMLEGHGSGRVVSIGIAPWGIIERNHELLGHNREVSCHSISTPRSKLAVLNNRHAYFLLVDNGTQGKYGAELILRRKLEKYLSNQQLQLPFTLSSSGPTVCKCTPVVCLVIEGGTNTIRAVLEYVTDNPPVPVVVCDGSGRAADLIAFVHRHEHNVLDTMKVEVCEKIKNTFEVSQEKAECLFVELLQCTLNKKLITVFCIQDGPEGKAQELDQTILTALFKSQSLKPAEQLSLVLTWNRVDIARSEIFVYGQEWPSGALDEAMMQALEHDRIDFVRLLLENGVSMKKFLTIPRLEELYNSKHGPANTLGYILRDIRTHIPKGYVYTLHDIGLVINKLMGGAYRSYYTRRKFRPIYAKVMNIYNTHNPHRKQSSVQRTASAANSMGMGLAAGLLPFTSEMALFEFPFNELLIWAVLTKRQQMAMLMWTHGEEALAKSLVACKLYKAMAHEAADDDLDTEIYEELRSYAKEFEQRGLKLLDFCYRQDADKTQRLLTCELHSWSSQSCLSLAVAANHRPLLAHPCSQIILADLWMGALRTRKNTNLKVILGLLFPPFIKKLDFKSKEELQSMPQTEEEHLENRNLDYEEEKKLPDAEALIPETFLYRNTKVQENGKVSLSDSDLSPFKGYYDNGFRQHRPLKLKKKFYEFYTAPITKFWADSMAYVLFLVLFSYTVLVKMQPTPSWQEFYSIAYITTLGCEKIREIVSSEPVAISHKFSVWAWNMWNPCDGAAIIFFIIGLGFRLKPNTMDVGRVIYCIDSMYWYLRILNILGVNKYLGPLVTMMGKMVKNMIYFVVLLLVVLMSFGVCRQAILFPNSEASWRLIREVYFQPYFMLYGEVFADDIDPPCGDDPAQSPCITGHWVTPIAMSMYLLIANILLINLLIAVFNNIFNEVNSVSHQVWMFQRFTVVMEYQQKPVLPPPMIAFCHCYSLLKYLIRKYKGLENVRDNGLKLFLEKEDMECLYDFEEECVEGYFKEQEVILLQSTEERIKNTDERVEHMSQRIEDINQKENKQTASVKDIALKIQKLEDATAQILDHLAVIHRFMATHTNMQDHFPGGSLINIGTAGSGVGGGGLMLEPRFRTVSETGTSSALQLPTRRKYNRSMSEMRPDTGPYDEPVSHLEVQTVLEENEYHKSPERERKFSVQSADDMDYIVMSPAGEANKKVSTPPVFKSSNSGESKDTLTPVDNSDAKTLVGEEEGSMEDFVDLNYEGLRQRAIRKRMGTGRRNSETLYDIRTSQSSLNQMIPMARRQQSLTQSEPDSGNEQPAIKPKVVNKRRQMLLQIHDEYTSITDELETACQMISSPTASLAEERQKTELTNPEFVALLEKQHLKECEENDYFILERLIQSRSSIEESYENTYGGIAIDFSHRRGLHRETAVELPITPSKSNTTVGDNNETTDFGVTNESQFRRHLSSERKISPGSNHNSPRNSQLYSQSSYLNPGPDLKSRLYKKSCESLQKNSSTETEYSLQRPYHVIKQSSNETNTSFNSSFNIENSSSFNNELSLDGDPTSMNATVIENVADDSRKTGPHLKKMPGVELGPANRLAAPESGDIAKLHKESTSSTSTEEARDERFLPKFTTNTVQDEIAKLSSTIKSSTEDEKAETPVNETMC